MSVSKLAPYEKNKKFYIERWLDIFLLQKLYWRETPGIIFFNCEFWTYSELHTHLYRIAIRIFHFSFTGEKVWFWVEVVYQTSKTYRSDKTEL